MALMAVILLSAISFMSAGEVTGQGNTWFKVTPVNNERAINVFVKQMDGEEYRIELISKNGTKIWRSVAADSYYEKSILLEELPAGHYTLAVIRGDMVVEQPFELTGESAEIIESERYLASPTLAVIGKSVLVDFPTTNYMDEVDVTIFDNAGKEVFANSITNDGGTITKYDMTALPAGSYNLRFAIGSTTFTRTIKLKTK